MTNEIKKSISVFVDELKKQMTIFENLKPDASIYKQDCVFLTEFFKNQGKDIKKLSLDDISNLTTDEMSMILSKAGVDRVKMIEYVYLFPEKKQNYLISKDNESASFFQTILDIILEYVNGVRELSNNRSYLKSEKTELYQKYIRLFSSDFNEIFKDLDELKKLMSSLAIASSDQWQIIKYINEKNIKLAMSKGDDVDFVKEVTDYINKYADETDEDVILISSQVSINLDVDLLPTTASNLSKLLCVPYDKCLAIVGAIVLNTLLTEYQNCFNENVIDYKKATSIREMMEAVLKNRVDVEIKNQEDSLLMSNDSVIEAYDILNSEREYIETNQNIDYKMLTEKSISELQSEEIDYEEAVKLKTLPVLKSISDTLSNLSKEISEEDFELCLGVLEELIQAYKSLREKIEIKRIA